MRFRFCGDLDCPDWVLAEINTLSRMTSIKTKLLCQVVIASLLGQELDYERAKKLTSDAKFEESEVRGGVAALGFVLRSAARHGADVASLDSELQQLGLPRELAVAVSRCHAENGSALAKKLADSSLRLTRLDSVQCQAESSNIGTIKVNLGYKDLLMTPEVQKEVNFTLTMTQVNTLLAELKTAQAKMQELESGD